MRERPLVDVPKAAMLLLTLGLGLQLAWSVQRPVRLAIAEDLPPTPSLAAVRIAGFGEPVALAKGLMLYLQAFDSQSGISVPFTKLDYDRVEGWLERILQLDPPGQYPLFSASLFYAQGVDETRQRRMFEFIYRKFLDDPNRRWPWLAHVVIAAKHQLKDLPLARKYAQAIRVHAISNEVPYWAREMEIFILQDMNEIESAKVLISGLLDSGRITDAREIRFLEKRFEELESKASARQAGR
ncbi:MAG: hypothetical protein HY847_02685 [Betaproteobacteria bacterium]|nr:hypothetical protein [Betaproteobacteria bacterium]